MSNTMHTVNSGLSTAVPGRLSGKLPVVSGFPSRCACLLPGAAAKREIVKAMGKRAKRLEVWHRSLFARDYQNDCIAL
jgi:hypothetical protein